MLIAVALASAGFVQQADIGRTAEENDLAATLGLLIGGAVALLGLVLVLLGLCATRRRKRIEAHGTEAAGVITSTWVVGGGGSAKSNHRARIALDAPMSGVTETTAVGATPPARGDSSASIRTTRATRWWSAIATPTSTGETGTPCTRKGAATRAGRGPWQGEGP